MQKGALNFIMLDLIWNGAITETKKWTGLAEIYQTWITRHDFDGPLHVLGSARVSLSVPSVAVQETSHGMKTTCLRGTVGC